ncbi:MAG: hypothetical protein ACE5FC_02230 [Myxococcota bacterium]
MDTPLATSAGTRLALSIGDVRIEVLDRERAWRFAPGDPHADFVVPEEGPADIRLTVRRGPAAPPAGGGCIYSTEGGLWNLYRDRGDLLFALGAPAEGGNLHRLARVDGAVSQGDVCITPAGDAPGFHPYPLRYPLDELLLINHLARGRGAILHACGVIAPGGGGWLFVGRSGAGKSTLSDLWAPRAGATILSDDRVILRPEGDGYRMHGTPWHGDAAASSPRSAPLAGIFLLAHAAENRARAARPEDAVAHLLVNCFAPFYDAAGMDWTLAFIAALAERVSVRHLEFLPAPSAIDYLLSGEAA